MLAPAVAGEVRLEQRRWIHFSAAFGASDRSETHTIDRNDFWIVAQTRFHGVPPLGRRGRKEQRTCQPGLLGY